MSGTEQIINLKENYCKDLDAYFYGPNFWQAGLEQQLKDVTAFQALWKPSPDRHCIWEVVRHINSWKWFSLEILKGNKVESMKEHNWKAIPDTPDEVQWKEELEKLVSYHNELKNLVANANTSFFEQGSDLSKYVREIIYHDCYHC